MPRGTVIQVRSVLRQVQGKARRVLKSLAQDIRAKESDLRRLRNDETKLAALARQLSASVSQSKRGASGKGGGRINWRAVLEKLPNQFKASHIRAMPRMKDKRPLRGLRCNCALDGCEDGEAKGARALRASTTTSSAKA